MSGYLFTNQSAKVIACTANPLDVIEQAGRICYKSHAEAQGEILCKLELPDGSPCRTISVLEYNSQVAFIRGLIERGHESVLEHVSISVHIVTDRGVSHELVRHRLASYSQESTRYCNYNKKGIACIDPVTEPQPLNTNMVRDAMNEAFESCAKIYERLVAWGVTPQIARAVLPNALKTELIMSANVREWRHFFKLRLLGTTGKPHPQIRALAELIFDAIATSPKICDGVFNPLESLFADLDYRQQA